LQSNRKPSLRHNRSDSALNRGNESAGFVSYANFSIQSAHDLLQTKDLEDLSKDLSKEVVEIIVTSPESLFFGDHSPVERLESAGEDTRSTYPTPSTYNADAFGDRERTKLRYKTAVARLQKVLVSAPGHWGSFQVPELDDDNVGNPIDQLRDEINKALRGLKCEKKKNYLEKGFKALSPFAKNFLTVAKEGQSVRHQTS
jgi:hypothetical protein